MSRIVIDGRMINATGIGVYTRNLLEHLQQLDHENEYIVLINSADWDAWKPTAPNFVRHRIHVPIYSWAEQFKLPGILRHLKPDLVHFTMPNAPIFYFGRSVLTIHDFTLLKFNNARTSRAKYVARQLPFRLAVTVNAWEAKAIITPSKYVAEDVGRHLGKRAQAKTTVTHEGLGEPEAHTSAPAPYRTPFIFYIGNLFPHKNLGGVIEAMPLLRQAHPTLSLVIAGQKDVFAYRLQERAKELGVGDAVIFTGYVDNQVKRALYHHASMFVFPSFSEGFGLPGLEAMEVGLPVASSNATCLPEVYGDAAVYFDPSDPVDIANVISEALSDKRKLAALTKAGYERCKMFSWHTLAEKTLGVYQKALRQG